MVAKKPGAMGATATRSVSCREHGIKIIHPGLEENSKQGRAMNDFFSCAWREDPG